MIGESLFETIEPQTTGTDVKPPVLSDEEFLLEYERHVELVSISINYQDGSFDNNEMARRQFISTYAGQFDRIFGPRIVDLEIDI